jgi:DNA-binding CsgD family transcriptional regulator
VYGLYPNPLPPPRPAVTRESTLAELQTGLASLTDDELQVARLWLVGESLERMCCMLRKSEKSVQKLWQSMRRKLRFALLDEAMRATEAPSPLPLNPNRRRNRPK